MGNITELLAEWIRRGRTESVKITDSDTLELEDDHDSRRDWYLDEDLG